MGRIQSGQIGRISKGEKVNMKRLGLDERAVLRLIPNSDTKRINRVDIMRITKFSERRVKKIIDVLVNDFDIVIIGGKKWKNRLFYSGY